MRSSTPPQGVFTYLVDNLGVRDVQFEELIALDADYLRQQRSVVCVFFGSCLRPRGEVAVCLFVGLSVCLILGGSARYLPSPFSAAVVGGWYLVLVLVRADGAGMSVVRRASWEAKRAVSVCLCVYGSLTSHEKIAPYTASSSYSATPRARKGATTRLRTAASTTTPASGSSSPPRRFRTLAAPRRSCRFC